jgi:hypothetical protein
MKLDWTHAGGNGVGLGSDSHRVELGGVQPGKRKPGGTEERNEQEETKGGTVCGLTGSADETAENDEHCDSLPNGTDEEQGATTDALDEEEGSKCEDGLLISAV